jgi:hypothetical protein
MHFLGSLMRIKVKMFVQNISSLNSLASKVGIKITAQSYGMLLWFHN